MSEATSASWRLAVDTGGTFTDLVLVDDGGSLYGSKIPSTPSDYSLAIMEGIEDLLPPHDVSPAEVGEIAHGTTVATNAVLEHKGAKTALVTTRGFRDVLELRRLNMPTVYDLNYQKPRPLVPRSLRLEVDERLDSAGDVVAPLDAESLDDVIERLRSEEIEAVAVALLNSYANEQHERDIEERISRELPDCYIARSAEILPQMEEYRRTSTAVVNAYVGPVVSRYLRTLVERLRGGGLDCGVLVMQSDGGVMGLERAARRPVAIVESGPAAGVVGAAQLGRRIGVDDLITFDMGGTTAKASLVHGGEVSQAVDYEVGAGINAGSRLNTGGGYAVGVPSIEIAEVGAGGGSIAWIDRGGVLHVGPESSGAAPGPVCYGKGGERPTVTDANLLLGYLNPTQLAGGGIEIDVPSCRAVFEAEVAKPLGLSLEEAAFGVHRIANANMQKAIRAVSTERGRDPSEFALVAFGGSGPVHGVSLARSLGIRRVIVPPAAGLFSSIGLLCADRTYRFSRTFLRSLETVGHDAIADAAGELEQRALSVLEQEGCDLSLIAVEFSGDIRFVGQRHELEVPLGDGAGGVAAPAELRGRFMEVYERTYGHTGDFGGLELVTLRVLARTPGTADDVWPQLSGRTTASSGVRRSAYFGEPFGFVEAPILARGDLSSTPMPGPLIVEEYDSTTVVAPGWGATVGDRGEMVIEEEAAS